MAANTSSGANLTGELITEFAQKSRLAKTQARQFYREFFTYVRESLLKENYLKIKGLGTFKLMAVGERESIDVTTGERIEISAHYRVVFTPDKSLASRVNRPFEHFDTIVLDEEGLEKAEMQQSSLVDTPESSQKEMAPEEKSPLKNDEELVHSVYLGKDQEDVLSVSESVISQDENEEEIEAEHVACVQSVAINEETPQESPKDTRETTLLEEQVDDDEESDYTPSTGIWWNWLVGIVVAVLLVSAGYFVGYYRLLGSTDWLGWEVQDTIVHPTPVLPVKSSVAVKKHHIIKDDSIKHETPALQSQEPDWKKEALNYPQLENGDYWIVGTLEEHEMKPGDGIIRLCMKIYGKKEMARYVIFYNQFSNPDNIPVGCKVKFPRLVPKD